MSSGEKSSPVRKFFSNIDSVLTTLMFVILLFLLGMQVFLRYVVNRSVSWSEEVSRWFFIWIIYFGCMLAAKEDKHIRVTVHLSKLPARVQKIIITLGDLVWIAFSVVIGVLGIRMVVEMFEFPYRSNTTGLNMAYIYTIIPIAFLTMAFWIGRTIVRRFTRKSEFELGDSRLDVD